MSYGSGSPGAPETAPGPYFDRARFRPAVSSTRQMAAQAGVAPAPFRLTGGRTTVIPLSNDWSERQDFQLRLPGPQPGALKTELRSVKLVSAAGVAPAIAPSRTEHVAAALRDVAPANGWRRGLFAVEDRTGGLGRTGSIEDWWTRRELHPRGRALAPSRRQRGALLIELRVRSGGKCW